jgi:hypothetical protein
MLQTANGGGVSEFSRRDYVSIRVGRIAVICQDEFGDPKITAANGSSDSKPFLLG